MNALESLLNLSERSAICLLSISIGIVILLIYHHKKQHQIPLADSTYSEMFLLNLIELLPEPIYFKDSNGTILLCNEALMRFLNMSKEEIIGKNMFDFLPPEDAKACAEGEKPLFEICGPSHVSYERVRMINGKKHYAVERKSAVKDSSGKLLGIVGIIIDITELKQAQEKLVTEKNRLDLALEIGNIAYWEHDLRTNNINISESGLRLLGYETLDNINTFEQFIDLIHPDDRGKFLSDLCSGLLKNDVLNLQFRVKRSDETYIWLESKTKPIETDFDSGEPVKLAGVLVDITNYKNEVLHQKQLINDLYTLATIDNLTGAMARWAGEILIKRSLSSAANDTYSIILFDLDNFKIINDSYGHLMGDAVLSKVGEIVKKSLRKTDLFVRWGGDEFMVFCQNSIEQTLHLAERLRRIIKEEFLSEGLLVTTSMGLTNARPGEPLEDIFRRADEALYKAKSLGKDQTYVIK